MEQYDFLCGQTNSMDIQDIEIIESGLKPAITPIIAINRFCDTCKCATSALLI